MDLQHGRIDGVTTSELPGKNDANAAPYLLHVRTPVAKAGEFFEYLHLLYLCYHAVDG